MIIHTERLTADLAGEWVSDRWAIEDQCEQIIAIANTYGLGQEHETMPKNADVCEWLIESADDACAYLTDLAAIHIPGGACIEWNDGGIWMLLPDDDGEYR